MRLLRLVICCWILTCASAHAARLTQAELARHFPAPLTVGDKAADVPAWPPFKQNGTAMALVGYAFESADLAPVPGFAGVPPNLLVVIDPKGTFLDVSVLSQHEPVFVDGLGEAPLRDFLGQYRGRSLGQGITVGGPGQLDGVSKATERFTREIAFDYRLPTAYYTAPDGGAPAWQAGWKARRAQLVVLVAALALLGVALWQQRRLVSDARRFVWLRRAWLLFTIGFIGYAAQAQLSIVNLTGIVQALRAGRGLDYLLFDPMTAALWAFVLVSLFIWGRGTFCGWLCPFGALQEFAGLAGQVLKLPQVAVRRVLDARLKRVKYGVLAAILPAAVWAPAQADKLVELEPFKTAITLNFVRAWPFVAYAAGLLLLAMVVHKAFCRYLCPLGAALALLGRVRVLDWIPRRAECGTPCQTCRHRCGYNAIAPHGAVDYEECFQCMECVVIHPSDAQCAPRILERKRARSIPIVSIDRRA